MSLRRSVPSSLVLLLCGRLALVPPRRVLLLPLWFRLLPFLRLRRFSSSSSAAVRASLFEIGCLPVFRLLSTSSSMGHSPLVVTVGHFRLLCACRFQRRTIPATCWVVPLPAPLHVAGLHCVCRFQRRTMPSTCWVVPFPAPLHVEVLMDSALTVADSLCLCSLLRSTTC